MLIGTFPVLTSVSFMQRVSAEPADSPHGAEEGSELSPKGHQLGLGRHQQHQYYTQQRLEQEQQQKQQEEQERQTLQQSVEADHQSDQPDAPQPGRRGLLRFVSRGRLKSGASANSRAGQGMPSEPSQAAASESVSQPSTVLQACPEDAECHTDGEQSGERQSAERMTGQRLGAERQSAEGHSAEKQSAERLNSTEGSAERHSLPNPAESVEMQSASQAEAGQLSGAGQQTHQGTDSPQGLHALSGQHLQQQLQGLKEAADQIRAACVQLQKQLQQQQQQQQ